MITYYELRTRHQKEFDAFPIGAAFSNKQFAEAMAKWGYTEEDTDKVVSIGAGCFIRKSDIRAFNEMNERHSREMKEAIEGDATGDGFIYSMFDYELANHEFSYTGDVEDTLDALDLTAEKVEADSRLAHGLKMAITHQYSLDM